MSNAFLSDLVPGKELSVFSKRAPRPATILAMRNNQMLVEYRFPHGTTALLCFDLAGETEEETWWGRNRQYKTLSLAWLQALSEAGIPWTGKPQQRSPLREPTPSAVLLLQQRRFRQFWRHGSGPQFLARIRKNGWKNVSWKNGGSLIAAQAIYMWIHSSLAHAYPSIQVNPMALIDRQDGAMYFLVSVVADGREWYIDTEGIRTKDAFLQLWSHLTSPGMGHLEEGEGLYQQMDVPHDTEISGEIASSLQEQVGSFSHELLFPMYERSMRAQRAGSTCPLNSHGKSAA